MRSQTCVQDRAPNYVCVSTITPTLSRSKHLPSAVVKFLSRRRATAAIEVWTLIARHPNTAIGISNLGHAECETTEDASHSELPDQCAELEAEDEVLHRARKGEEMTA